MASKRYYWTPEAEEALAKAVAANQWVSPQSGRPGTNWDAVAVAVGAPDGLTCTRRWNQRTTQPLRKVAVVAAKPRKIVSPGNHNIGNGKAPAAPGVLGTTLAFSFCPNCGCNLARVNSALAAVQLIEQRVRS